MSPYIIDQQVAQKAGLSYNKAFTDALTLLRDNHGRKEKIHFSNGSRRRAIRACLVVCLPRK
jgi:hypothetical protein